MIFEAEDFKVTSDSHQFSLYSLQVVEAGEKVKPENIGTVKAVLIGHYSKFDQLVRGAIKHELSSKSVETLESIQAKIDSVSSQFAGVLR